MHRITWADETLDLYPERALGLPASETLVIADTHFGKPACFRAAGIPVPAGTTEADLTRLESLLARTAAKRLVILGDFFHARTGRDDTTMAALETWFAARQGLEVILVRGNHDAHAGDPPPAWGIECVAPPHARGKLLCCHVPEAAACGAVLAGHLHPAVVLSGFGGDSLRAPCFWFAPSVATLPAFGSFTGMHAVRCRRGDRVFAVGPDEVVEIPVRR